jgi:hypothetical protein
MRHGQRRCNAGSIGGHRQVWLFRWVDLSYLACYTSILLRIISMQQQRWRPCKLLCTYVWLSWRDAGLHMSVANTLQAAC